MQDTPTLALTLAYWLHMLSTVVWIGGLAALSVIVLPAARQALDPSGQAAFLERVQRRLDPLGWFCLVVLVGTGMLQMAANPNYGGLLAIDNAWAAAILIKHVVIFGMVGVSALLTWGVLPALRRAALRREKDPAAAAALQRRETVLINLNLVLSIVVLALTAMARAQ